MDDNNNNSFLDKNTLLAILFSILFFVGWQLYVQKKYPQPKEEVKTDFIRDDKKAATTPAAEADPVNPNPTPAAQDDVVENQEVPEKVFTLAGTNMNIKLSSKGMGLTDIELNQYSDRSDVNIDFNSEFLRGGNFATLYDGKPIHFMITQEGNQFVGIAKAFGFTIHKKMVFDDSTYSVKVSIETTPDKASATKPLETLLSSHVLEVKSSFFTPSFDGTEVFFISDGSEERQRFDISEDLNLDYGKTVLSSVGTLYFAIAVRDESDLLPDSKVAYSPKDKNAFVSVLHPLKAGTETTKTQYTGFMGPKQFDILKKLQPEFVQLINYGMFSFLAKPILGLLQYLFKIVHNWGLAIILLTIFIRLLLLPINISSMKSMKKMQKIQPQLKAIKEKFKDDPVRVNQETMALMKREKANPIGGCLPMLLQLPVFFALYSALGQSVELYKSPFIFWIKDLSYHDPYFVLPIAVGILYYIQMSITPQPADPTQAKVMKFIPIMFCFFMITVPSGLTLYFFVNTVFGIGQQLIFQRDKVNAPS